MVRVKICGLTTPEAVDAAARADAIGFLFVAGSPRAISPADARPLIARGRPEPVGVFADPDDALLEAAIAAGIGTIQLHGREPPARVAQVKARFGRPVWKAAGVRTADDIRELGRSYPMADALLLDDGGHGARFDWAILRDARPRQPWILAGGLDPDNVEAAIFETGAEFVDVSSGVEDAPGVKSLAKIHAFLARARRG
jgi:phosphoribosylanthranilate isomerase